MSQDDIPAWDALTSDDRVREAKGYVHDVLTAALALDDQYPRLIDRTWCPRDEAELILKRPTNDWTDLIEKATRRAEWFEVLLECITLLLEQGRSLPPVLRQWQVRLNRGEVSKPQQHGHRKGSTLNRNVWLALLVDDVARISGLNPTRSTATQPCMTGDCPFIHEEDPFSSCERDIGDCRPVSACDLIACVLSKNKHGFGGFQSRNWFALLAKLHGQWTAESD